MMMKNKKEKQDFVRAVLSGNRSEVERILRGNEHPIYFEMLPGRFCTYQQKCDCQTPDGCRHLKPKAKLRADYPKAVFFEMSKTLTLAELENLKAFGFEATEPLNMVVLRNAEIKFIEKFKNEN